MSALPPNLQAACGHPGTHVHLTHVPITVSRAECDLTGVVVIYRNAGATVPAKPGGVSGFADGTTAATSGTINVAVTKKSVTIDGGR